MVCGSWQVGKNLAPTYHLLPTVLLYSMRGNSEEQFEQARKMDLANLPQQNRKRLKRAGEKPGCQEHGKNAE